MLISRSPKTMLHQHPHDMVIEVREFEFPVPNVFDNASSLSTEVLTQQLCLCYLGLSCHKMYEFSSNEGAFV